MAPRTVLVELTCPECGNKTFIHRKKSKLYSSNGGHVKDLWCYRCKAITKHVEAPRLTRA